MSTQRGSLQGQNGVVIACPGESLVLCHAPPPHQSQTVTNGPSLKFLELGSAYVGSNPTPATACEDGPLAGNSRLCGPFFCVPPCVTL